MKKSLDTKIELPKLDPNVYPTLITYNKDMIQKAVIELIKNHNLTLIQALNNLEMDLAEIDQRTGIT